MAQKADSVNLGQGFPSFATPDFVKACAVRAVEDGHNQYTRPGGNPFLADALAGYYSPLFGRELDPMREIATCNGAQEGIYNVLATFADPGDQVVCIEPYFDAYKKSADMVGVETVGVPLRLRAPAAGRRAGAGDFELDLDELESAITDRTKLLVLNTPHNPVGKVFTRDELAGVAEVVSRHPRVLVLSDEVYEFMTMDGLAHERFALLDGMYERTISLFSAGKTFSCTGWRVGYCIGPPHLVEPLIATQGVVSFCAPTNNQVAVGLAMREAVQRGYFAELASTLQRKRDVLTAALDAAGLTTIGPQGGYFVLADTSLVPVPASTQAGGRRDQQVNEWLTENVGITGIPTSFFYSDHNRGLSDNVLRFAYCKQDAEIAKAADRLRGLGGGMKK